MDKQGFVFAFDEVEDDHRHRELLGGRERAIVVIDVASCKEEGQVDEDGSGVFDDEDGEPRDLEAWKSVDQHSIGCAKNGAPT